MCPVLSVLNKDMNVVINWSKFHMKYSFTFLNPGTNKYVINNWFQSETTWLINNKAFRRCKTTTPTMPCWAGFHVIWSIHLMWPYRPENMADVEATKSLSGLLNGIAQKVYYNNSDITEELLKNELYPDLSQEEFKALYEKMKGLLKVIKRLHRGSNLAEILATFFYLWKRSTHKTIFSCYINACN